MKCPLLHIKKLVKHKFYLPRSPEEDGHDSSEYGREEGEGTRDSQECLQEIRIILLLLQSKVIQ